MCARRNFRRWSSLLGTAFSLCLATAILWSPVTTAQDNPPDSTSPVNAKALVREMVKNELDPAVNGEWRFRDKKWEDGKPEQLSEMVEVKDGVVHRLLAIDGRQLDSNEQETEKQRLQKIISDPAEVADAQKHYRNDVQNERRMLAMLPEAFQYQYAGEENGVIRLRFVPNPNFHSGGREERVFHHMEGFLLIDAQQKRLVEISGRLNSEVKFGGGLLGHLDPGGTFRVRQADIRNGDWEMTELNVQMDGRVLFFKTIAVKERELRSDFKPVPPNLTARQGAEILENEFAAFAREQVDSKATQARAANRLPKTQ